MGAFGFEYLLAFAAGVSFVFQQAVNSNLRVEIASPWWLASSAIWAGLC